MARRAQAPAPAPRPSRPSRTSPSRATGASRTPVILGRVQTQGRRPVLARRAPARTSAPSSALGSSTTCSSGSRTSRAASAHLRGGRAAASSATSSSRGTRSSTTDDAAGEDRPPSWACSTTRSRCSGAEEAIGEVRGRGLLRGRRSPRAPSSSPDGDVPGRVPDRRGAARSPSTASSSRATRALTAEQIKDAMPTQGARLLDLPFAAPCSARCFDDDVERILQLYDDHGYIQARVESHRDRARPRARRRSRSRIRVVGGPAVPRRAPSTITGNELLPDEEIRRRIQLKAGDVFSRGALRDSRSGRSPTSTATIGRAPGRRRPRTDERPGEPQGQHHLRRSSRGPRSTSSGSTSAATRRARRRSCAASSAWPRASCSRTRSWCGAASGCSTWATSTR